MTWLLTKKKGTFQDQMLYHLSVFVDFAGKCHQTEKDFVVRRSGVVEAELNPLQTSALIQTMFQLSYVVWQILMCSLLYMITGPCDMLHTGSMSCGSMDILERDTVLWYLHVVCVRLGNITHHMMASIQVLKAGSNWSASYWKCTDSGRYTVKSCI